MAATAKLASVAFIAFGQVAALGLWFPASTVGTALVGPTLPLLIFVVGTANLGLMLALAVVMAAKKSLP